MLNALLNLIKRIGRSFDPAQSAFSLTPTGRIGPLPKKPDYVSTPWPKRRTSVAALVVIFILGFLFDRYGEAIIRWLVDSGVIQSILHGIEIIFFVFLGVTAVSLAGRLLWGIQRLHDLGRSAGGIAPDLAWMLAAMVPVVVIAHGLDTMIQLPTERSNLLASYLAAFALWLAPFYMAFWSQHLKTWNETVETAPGDPGENRYGAAPHNRLEG